MNFIKHNIPMAPQTDTGASTGPSEEAIIATINRLASKENESMSDAVNLMVQAKADWEGGPFKVYFAMEANYSEEELAEFPEPGREGGNNPDVFYEHKKNAKGEMVKRKTSFYTKFADATKEGREVNQALNYVLLCLNENADKSNVPDEYKALGEVELKVLESKLTGRRSTIRTAYKSAMRLRYQLQAVNTFEGVTVFPIFTDENENAVMEGSKCIQIAEYTDPSKPPKRWRSISKGSLNKMNANKARELVAQGAKPFDALLKTLERVKDDNKDAKNKDKNKPQSINTSETFEARMMDIYQYIDTIDTDRVNGPGMAKELEKRLLKAGSDDFLEAIGRTYHFLDRFMRQDRFQTRYQTILDSEEDGSGTDKAA